MKKTFFVFTYLSILVVFLSGCTGNSRNGADELWYRQPAGKWEEALPIGNGRLGAMIFGQPGKEHLQFNEETLWDCYPRDHQREGAFRYLAEIRQLLQEGKQAEAELLAGKEFMGRRSWEDEYSGLKQNWLHKLTSSPEVTGSIGPGHDDKEWPVMKIEGRSLWETKGLPDLDGCVIFRKSINLPAGWKGKSLHMNLGSIKDLDITYFNGVKTGETEMSDIPRIYKVPGSLVKEGANLITVQVFNFTSTGGFNGFRNRMQKMTLIPVTGGKDTLFLEGEWKYKIMDSQPPSFPQYEADYQPFGDMYFHFPGHENFTDYRRSLDISKATSEVTYKNSGITFRREYIASHPDELIAIHLTADKKGMQTFSIKMTSPHAGYEVRKVDDQTLALGVKVADGVLRGTSMIKVESQGGKVEISADSISVKEADKVTIRQVAATSYLNYKDVSGDPDTQCREWLKRTDNTPWEALLKRHKEDYQSLYHRFKIDLGGHEKRVLPTDERITGIKSAPDNDLAALYVQYSRYLLLASARKGTFPPNLQGIWNDQVHPPWGSKYTTNINTEMNFWGTEILNLSECHESLFKMLEEVSVEGAKTAKAHYNARGWVLHHNTDLWRGTAPINASNHGIWVTGGAWLCHHLWEHYQFTQDTVFLETTAWPIIRGAALFFLDFLTEDPETGFLISTPSNSPENGGLVAGPTMDHEIIRSLFKIVIACTEILKTDENFAAEIKVKLEKLAPYKIGKFGQLQEWLEDKDDTANKHRHVSHLWAIYPGNEITFDETPELMEAAKKSLIYRGDAGTGWSLAWKIAYWARFQDGDHAHRMIQMLLSPANDPERRSAGGSYPNLFDAHPPFQIDGNFGGGAGMAEMLLQSHQGYCHILPSLPSDWKEGKVNGLRARGGFEIDITWKDNRLESLKVLSLAGKPLKIRYQGQTIGIPTKPGGVYLFNGILKPKM